MWAFIYIIVMFISCVMSLLLTVRMRTLSIKLDFVDRPGYHKAHGTPVPLLGGVSIFFSFIITITSGIVFTFFTGNNGVLPEFIREYLPGIKRVLPKLIAIFSGALIVFILGVIDDRKSLGAVPKIVFQILAGTIVFSLGLRITLFTSNIIISYVFTILWILIITNAFNLLDNMDGLSGGVACVSGIVFLLISAMNQQYFVSLLLSAFIGSILGFLYFNFYPATIYMGDAGSMVIGFIMAVSTLLGTYYYPGLPTIFPVAMPLLILSIPIYDTVSVIVIRVNSHKPIYQGDRNHFSHRLVALGMSKPLAVLFIYLVTFATGISSLLLQLVDWQGVVIILIQVCVFLSIIAILEYFGKRHE